MKKKLTRFLAMTVMSATVMATAVTSVAASSFSDEDLENLQTSVESFVTTVYALDEETLDTLDSNGDFYEVTEQAIKDNQEELGAFIGVESSEAEYDADEATATITVKAEFENYDAEIIVTYDTSSSAPKNFMVNPEYPLAMNMANAARNTVIGVVVVFLILLFLSFVISLLKYVNPDGRKAKKNAEAPAEKPAAAPAQKAPAAVKAPVAATATDNSELIAVMAAAIAAASADGADGSTYVVRSIKKVGTGKRWKRS